MLIEYSYSKSEPDKNNKRRYYSLVECDGCGKQREARQRPIFKQSDYQHLCISCHGKRRAAALHELYPEANKGRQSPFKGKVRGPYKEPMTTSYIDSYGYRQVWCGKHAESRGRKDGYRAEHHLVAEDMLKRRLLPGEIVHHIDGDKLNNTTSNLVVCRNQKEHRAIHSQLEVLSMSLVRSGAIKWNGHEYVVDNFPITTQAWLEHRVLES